MLSINPMPGHVLTQEFAAHQRPWHELVHEPDPRCDPYLIWFDLSFVSVRDAHGSPKPLRPDASIDVMLELPAEAVVSAAAASAYLGDLGTYYGFVVRTHPVPLAKPQCFVCGYLPIRRMVDLADAIARRQPRVHGLRMELASPRFVAEPDGPLKYQRINLDANSKPVPALGLFSSLPMATIARQAWLPPGGLQVQPYSAWSSLIAKLQMSAIQPATAAPIVVVIDDACNHASHALGGRVRSIWHQGHATLANSKEAKPGAAATDAAQTLDFRDELYGLVQDLAPPGRGQRTVQAQEAEAERHVYSQHGRDKLTPHWTHGSAVLSLVAHRTTCPVPGSSPDGLSALTSPDTIEFVQLPDAAVLDTSGGSLNGYALDAIHRAARLGCEPLSRPVIVNLSFGTHSGPHDGSSMFERALQEMLEIFDGSKRLMSDGKMGRMPTLHVVLPSGNTQLERTHASGWLEAKGPAEELLWMIPPDTETDSFVEIWIDDDAKGQVGIELLPPDGDASTATAAVDKRTVLPGSVKVWEDNTGPGPRVLHAAVIYPNTTSKGTTGRLALVAVAPTQRRANQGQGATYRSSTDRLPQTGADGGFIHALERTHLQAAAGCWRLRLTNTGTDRVGFHAWIQRHDTAPGRRRASKGYRGRQSSFVECQGNAVNPHFTLNGIATGSVQGQLWVVGAMDESGAIPLYAAAGPDRNAGQRIEGPDASLTVDRGRNVPGRHVHGVFSGSRLRLGGTSMAAAAFTRMLYHTLAGGGTMSWCGPEQPSPGPVKTPESPAMADDWMRGSMKRLMHARDLSVHGPSGQDQLPAPDPAGSCAR